jgi:hypothetical protein
MQQDTVSAFNSPAVWMAAIGVLGTFLTGVVTIVLALISRSDNAARHAEVTQQNAAVAEKVETVRQDVNGKMAQLVQVSGDAREAKGNLEGHAEEKANPS